MAVKARASITLTSVVDISAVYRYYLLQSSTLATPSAPTTNPPGGDWVTAEPGYTSGSTNSLYTVDLTVFSDGSFLYSTVSLSSSYEAAKAAYNRAVAAGEAADAASTAVTETREALGALEYAMEETYLAKSDYGVYEEQIYAHIEETARQIVESYNYAALASSVDNLTQYITLLDGEIRRGFIEVDGVMNFGIVISSRNVFAANESTYTPTGESNVYYEIDTGECFGLYTASGWQFWKGNQKLGWFDTSDGQLHVNNINIESNLIMGDWRLTNNGTAWGLKYVGA